MALYKCHNYNYYYYFRPHSNEVLWAKCFSAYQEESEFHTNVPKEMWTTAWCTFQKDDSRAGTKGMFPGNSHVKN